MAALAPSRVLVSNWGFDWGLFWDGANAWPILLAQDGFVFVLVLPLVLALYFKARKQGVWHAESIIFFITVNLLVPSLLFGFTVIANTAYRTVPLFGSLPWAWGCCLPTLLQEKRATAPSQGQSRMPCWQSPLR